MSNATETVAWQPLSRREMARRIADDIQSGWYVNLGIGIPTLVADCLDQSREVVIHSENGILGMGPAPASESVDPWLVNAGKQYVSLYDGGSFFRHSDSFAMIRGGHLDLCVLGAYEVADNGDLANWATTAEDDIPAVGGAMDLAVGAKRVWVIMEHTTRDGGARLVSKCSYPLTAPRCVSRIYTNLATIDVEPEGFVVRSMIEGLAFEELQKRTAAPLIAA